MLHLDASATIGENTNEALGSSHVQAESTNSKWLRELTVVTQTFVPQTFEEFCAGSCVPCMALNRRGSQVTFSHHPTAGS